MLDLIVRLISMGRPRKVPPKPPKLELSERSIASYLAWLGQAVIAGHVSPSAAKEASSALKGSVTALRAEFSKTEMDELKELVRRSEEVERSRQQAIVRQRTDGSVERPLVRFPIEVAAPGPYRPMHPDNETVSRR